ncbi:hypothetical protein [Erwinia aphidicola]|uniref:hypothetical protein n=1 Tax=Erwinia aphidicola TaxID=68334 RepID=UPI0030CB2DE1
MLRHRSHVVQDNNQRRPGLMPFRQQRQQQFSGIAVDAGKRLIQQQQFCVLYQQPGKQHALQLPAG